MLDYWINREEYKQIVYDALEELHWEISFYRSFKPAEVAKRAGVPEEIARRALEDLRRDGVVGKRRYDRYYIKKYWRMVVIRWKQ